MILQLQSQMYLLMLFCQAVNLSNILNTCAAHVASQDTSVTALTVAPL